MKIEKIDHICFAVRDIEKTKEIYKNNFALEPDVEYVAESESIRVARYYIGEVAVEFLESTSPGGEVSRFIERRGEGVFLISYRVDDLEGALQELKEKGQELIDDRPRSLFGNRYAFIQRPERLCGVLTELLDGDFDRSQVGKDGQAVERPVGLEIKKNHDMRPSGAEADRISKDRKRGKP